MVHLQHPRRVELNDEVHARPPEALVAPGRLSYLALISDDAERGRQWGHLALLAGRYGVAPPEAGSSHFSADFGAFRLKAERHTEFTGVTVIVAAGGGEPFAPTALDALPKDWTDGLAGELLVGAHVALLAGAGELDHEALSRELFAGHVLVGSRIAGGTGAALTDFRLHADGFSRFMIFDRGMSPRQCGRMAQRLIEIETYRMMALLALPVARALSPELTRYERELARITTAMAAGAVDEPALLDRLTRLEAEIDSRAADHHFRFSASRAYYDLVQRRLLELREDRISGLQTFGEFMERRLTPAVSTCGSVAARLASLPERVAKATQLLATRVAVARERQNQEVLATMNRRAALQLRLQETVEGLSVAAITYYIVGLIGYVAKGVHSAGVGIHPDLAVALSVPFVVAFTALGVRRIRTHATSKLH